MRIYFSNGDLTSLMGGGGKRLHTGGPLLDLPQGAREVIREAAQTAQGQTSQETEKANLHLPCFDAFSPRSDKFLVAYENTGNQGCLSLNIILAC